MKASKTAATVLEDALLYLRSIQPNVYQQKIPILFDVSIGQHTRHFIEFYQCLLQQVSENSTSIDYASRKRNYSIETDPQFAVSCIVDISTKIKDLNIDQNIVLDCSEHLPGEGSYCVNTNVERELIYNIEHTIHHLAIIKIGLKAIAPQIQLPAHFGVAPSTIQNNKKACAQ